MLRTNLVIGLIFACGLAIVPRCSFADNTPHAVALVTRIHDAILQIAHGGEESIAVRARSSSILRSSIDAPSIARTVLGPFWAETSRADREDFIDALGGAVAESLVRRLGRHPAENFSIRGNRGLSGGDVLVMTQLMLSNDNIMTLDWRIRRCASGLCIVDFIVGGASVSIQRRDEFVARLRANGGLLAELTGSLRAKAFRGLQ